MSAAEDTAELELEARQLPSVAAVSCRTVDGAVRVQVLVTDPGALPAVRHELEALLARVPGTERSELEVRTIGMARRRLALERDLVALPGVRSCDVTRGHRGEIRHVTVVTGAGADLDEIRACLADGLGPDFPPQQVQIEVGGD